MTQYTSNYRIPYPTASDPVYLGASQMEALAKRVDDTMTSVHGSPGPAGPAGPQGARGPQGDRGPAGATGEPGPRGEQGPQGDRGPRGERGEQGEPGTGFTLLGTVGTVGDLPTGAKGGAAYLVESTGDVYVWSGTQWSNVGAIRGPAGPRGERGEQGTRGPQGEAGPRGEAGPQGERGVQGPTGATGPQGARGPQGPQGEAGPAPTVYYGCLRWSGPWYNPAQVKFSRLLANSGAKMYVAADRGGVAKVDGDAPRLIAPVAGMYLLSATQTWGNAQSQKGMGLAGSRVDGGQNVRLWADVNDSGFGQVTALRYLQAGETLYPWVWAGQALVGMSGGDRGIPSEYSMALIASI